METTQNQNIVNLGSVEAAQQTYFPAGTTAYSVSFALMRAAHCKLELRPMPTPAEIEALANKIDFGDITQAEELVFFDLLPLCLELYEKDIGEDEQKLSYHVGNAHHLVYIIRNRWIAETRRECLIDKVKTFFGLRSA